MHARRAQRAAVAATITAVWSTFPPPPASIIRAKTMVVGWVMLGRQNCTEALTDPYQDSWLFSHLILHEFIRSKEVWSVGEWWGRAAPGIGRMLLTAVGCHAAQYHTFSHAGECLPAHRSV